MSYTLPVIAPDTVDQFAYSNQALLLGTPRAVALNFHGLNAVALRTEPTAFEIACAEHDVLSIWPYYGPWSWMNLASVRYVDDIVDAFYTRLGLPRETPLLSTGGSMGGLSAIIYTRYAHRTPEACFANCPVCDLPYHATERPDLPRTVYLAFARYECGLEQALIMHSPLHQVQYLPDIPYYVVHGTADTAVNKARHSDRFVAAMRQYGKRVTYVEVPGMTHCDLGSFPDVQADYLSSIFAYCQ